jgi:hypothetical protein
MVTTRSNITSYTTSLPEGNRPNRSTSAPIANYFARLDGDEKSILIRKKVLPVHQLALLFHWFLRNIVPIKKSDIEEDFDELFSRVRRGDYPSYVRRVLSKDRRRRSAMLISFRKSLKYFYEQIYGPNRLFNIIKDDVLGHKVTIHENLFQLHGNKRTGKIPFHAVSESLVGALFTCLQADLLTTLNHNSVYEYNRTKYVLTGPLYFVPHHCDSMLSFDKPYMHDLLGVNIPTVKLFAEDPHSSSFKVGDSVTVNYHMGEHASEFNFTCACGSSNCISLNK